MHKSSRLLLLLLAGFCSLASASSCPEFFASGNAPVPQNPKLLAKFQELCNKGYAVGYSGITRTPLWSAEVITKGHVSEQKGVRRENTFHVDERIAASERAELSDYQASGFDRGHMTPSASAWTHELQNETFSLSNMIPQNAENNRGLHSHIETAVRNLTGKYAKLYVITGPVYSAQSLTWMHGRVAVPNKIFKLVYEPVSGRAAAYLEENAPGDQYTVVPISEIDALTSIDLLPGVKVRGALDLPLPVSTDSKFPRSHPHPTSIFATAKHLFGVRF